ncbi:MAG: hypothetical protein O7E54_02290, partial [Planctomycetota bacterium]|nr:hypothetical protein [Planctomycetota bacterium]
SGLLEHFHAVEPSARLSDERDRARDAKNGATTWFVQSGIGETEELKRARAEYDRARASEARGDTTAARFSYGEARAAFEAILKDAPQLLLAREAAAKAKHGAQAAESRWRTFARSADADLLAKIPGHEVAKTSLERATRHLDNSDYGTAAREFASASKGYEQALVVAESVRLDRMLETVRKEGLAAKKRYDEFISGKPAFKSTAADIGVKVWGEARQASDAGDKDAAIKGYSEVKLQFAKALAEVEEEAKRVPKGEEILQRMFKEMRTAEANRIIRTTSGVGVMRLSTGGELTVMSYSKHPNHTVSQMISPMGRLVSGGDGKVFWTWNPITQEVAITKGIERLMLLRESASLFEWKKHYKSVETQGKERIKGRECFKLRMPHKGSDGHDLLFIDTETLRPAQRTIRVRKDGFETYTKTTVGDYRKIGAFYFPFRSEIESPQGSATLVTREFLVNPTLPRDLFVRPPAVIDALEDDEDY